MFYNIKVACLKKTVLNFSGGVRVNKKIVSALVALGLIISSNITVFAEPLSGNRATYQQRINESRNSLQDVKSKRQKLESDVEKMDNQIEELMHKISETKNKISSTKNEIKKAEKDIVKAEENIKKEQELFNKRVRAMYMNGVGSYLDIIVEAEGLSDLVSKVDSIKRIMDMDKKIISDLNDKRQALATKKQKLDDDNKKLLALQSGNESKLSDINKKKREQDTLLAQLRSQESMYAARISENQAQIDAAIKQVNKIRDNVPKYVPSRGSSSLSSDTVVAYASNFLGTPYTWGGNGPNTFDCSGFVKYVYAHFGVSLPRVASDQQGAGSPVSRGNLQPGDLVFFGSPAHHVGIYVGNNAYMHAPRTGDVVKISPLTRSDYSGATRVR